MHDQPRRPPSQEIPTEISSLMAPLVLDSWQIYLMTRFGRRMMLRSLLLSAFAFVLMLCWTTAPLVAHHSFAAEFDGNKPVKVTGVVKKVDRKSTRLNSSHGYISYAVFCLKKKKGHRSAIERH